MSKTIKQGIVFQSVVALAMITTATLLPATSSASSQDSDTDKKVEFNKPYNSPSTPTDSTPKYPSTPPSSCTTPNCPFNYQYKRSLFIQNDTNSTQLVEFKYYTLLEKIFIDLPPDRLILKLKPCESKQIKLGWGKMSFVGMFHKSLKSINGHHHKVFVHKGDHVFLSSLIRR